MIDFKSQIDEHQQTWIGRRRDLHRHPELGFEEVRTAGIVAEELNRLGIEVRTGVGKTGVIGLLEGDNDGPTVLVRADMDALPVQEENETDYASHTPNVMHACGHDGHTTIALAVAEVLSAHRDRMAGRVKFVFQPAEEIGLGALAMIDDGVLQDPRPDVALGLHVWNEVPVGSLALVGGPMMAALSNFKIIITGRGGHGALPHETRDPIVAASQIVTALQSIVSRNINPTDVGVISITEFKAGDSFNVIPLRAQLRGTIRAFDKTILQMLESRLREVTDGIALALGCQAELTVEERTPPVVNAEDVSAKLRPVFERVAPDIAIISEYKTMASEDMSYFLDAIPGTFFFVGSANPERGLDYPHHHPQFDFDDEAVIPLAVNLLASAVAAYVLPD